MYLFFSRAFVKPSSRSVNSRAAVGRVPCNPSPDLSSVHAMPPYSLTKNGFCRRMTERSEKAVGISATRPSPSNA